MLLLPLLQLRPLSARLLPLPLLHQWHRQARVLRQPQPVPPLLARAQQQLLLHQLVALQPQPPPRSPLAMCRGLQLLPLLPPHPLGVQPVPLLRLRGVVPLPPRLQLPLLLLPLLPPLQFTLQLPQEAVGLQLPPPLQQL